MQRNLTIVICLLAIAGIATADQGRTEIGPTDTFPIVIDTPGSYVLTADLHVTNHDATAIEITADGVSLDLGGHVVRGPGQSTATGGGIFASQHAGLTIRNGTVQEFLYGIIILGGDPDQGSNRIEDLTVGWCGHDGVALSGGTARNIVVHDNGLTVQTAYGLNCVRCAIRDVTARGNYNGIRVFIGSAENCLASENLSNGFDLVTASLRGGAASENGGDGVYSSAKSVVIGVTVASNTGWGIQLTSGSASNVVNCTGGGNGAGNITGCADGNGCHQNYLP